MSQFTFKNMWIKHNSIDWDSFAENEYIFEK